MIGGDDDNTIAKQASKQASKQARNSSIELLKIVAIFLIVISHVSQTLIDKNAYVSWNDYLILTTVSSFLYIVCNFVKSGLFFTSPLLLWIVIYIVLTYFKRYSMNKMDNVKINLVFLIISFTINVLLIIGTNYLGLHINFFSDKVLCWWTNCNPFLLVAAFSLFNFARNVHFTNKTINYISSMSMLIYIIHENELLRTYYRPALWHAIYNQFGYDHLIFWVFVMSLGVFAFGVVMSMIYHHTLEKVVNKEVDWLLPKIQKLYGKYEKIVIGEAYTD